MSKYLSKAATKRLPLTSKRARKGYYKGNGATKEGHITSKGRFIVDRSKQLELIVPDLTNFKVSLLLLLLLLRSY
jgi:large subunit ribosomal protein L41